MCIRDRTNTFGHVTKSIGYVITETRFDAITVILMDVTDNFSYVVIHTFSHHITNTFGNMTKSIGLIPETFGN